METKYFKKKLTGDEKSTAINPELSCRAIVSKHLRFVNQNFDPKFFWNFRQKMSSSTLILKKQPIPIDEESIFDIHIAFQNWPNIIYDEHFWVEFWVNKWYFVYFLFQRYRKSRLQNQTRG